MPFDIWYANEVLLSNFEHETAFDRDTGYQLDAVQVGTSMCFVEPWRDPSEPDMCRAPNDPGVMQVHHSTLRQPGSLAWDPALATTCGSGTTPDWCYATQRLQIPAPPTYTEGLYPRNMVPGDHQYDWIKRAPFRNFTRNTAEQNAATATDAWGRRKRFKQFILGFPLTASTTKNPFSPSTWNTTVLADHIEQNTGLFSQIYNRSANASVPGSKAHTKLSEFLTLCKKLNGGPFASNWPDLHFNGRDRFNFFTAPRVVQRLLGVPDPAFEMAGTRCQFHFDAVKQRVTVSMEMWNTPAGSTDNAWKAVTYACHDEGPSPLHWHNVPIKTCQQRWTGAGWQDIVSEALVDGHFNAMNVWDDDVEVDVTYNLRGQLPPRIMIRSRYWDPTKTAAAPRNRVNKVEAFLFANQFVAYVPDSDVDRQLRIHGGIAARDVIGRFINRVGSDRTYAAPTQLHQSANGNVMAPSLIIYQDPRFSASLDFIYGNFGTPSLKR
jgi:hypothetical protein